MTNRPGLDDHRQAQFAWARFRRIMWWMAAFGLAVGLVVAGLLWVFRGPLPLLFLGMTIAGVWSTIMMAALLMGLMFLSSGTGHDDQVDDRISPEILDED
ncbi:hypothetical protein [Sphingobium lignivorans]|uniref:Na+-driven multidrug efflux pump n=1 Tax=Sphingobium lignivorans TaxID=2735886 RepID=A0ABR6NNC5_9SPHN|nr:hypothetical protein [Sphingobium lignivorans]MBB5987699.1 Na+-driven multidrug efflux pump [Sphingobium lignivorans]